MLLLLQIKVVSLDINFQNEMVWLGYPHIQILFTPCEENLNIAGNLTCLYFIDIFIHVDAKNIQVTKDGRKGTHDMHDISYKTPFSSWLLDQIGQGLHWLVEKLLL